MKQWSVPMRLEFVTRVTVEAETAAEAHQKAAAADFVDDGLNGGGELVNWELTGPPQADEETP